MGALARRQWRKRPNLTHNRPANPRDGRTAYDHIDGRPATIMDAELREPVMGHMASNYDGSHISEAVRNVLDKFSDEVADKIRRPANADPTNGNVWPWDFHIGARGG